MATADTKDPNCLMCLDVPAVTTIDSCQHSYCRSCLTKYQDQHVDAETFPCPTCRVQCPKQTSGNVATAGRVEGSSADAGAVNVNHSAREDCKVCGYKDTRTQAVNICWACSNLPLCKDCTLVHSKTKATQNHVVIPLHLFKKEDFLCKAHGEQLKGFCCTCTEPLCPVCVIFEHGDHEIKSLGEVCLLNRAEVKTEMEFQEKRLEELRSDQRELREFMATALEMEGTLVKAIEDQAELSIEQIIKKKDDLKKKVKEEFGVISKMTESSEALQKLMKRSEEIIDKSKKLLENVELSSKYIKELWMITNEQFTQLEEDQLQYGKCKATYRADYDSFKQKALRFSPTNPELEIGHLELKGLIYQRSAKGNISVAECDASGKFIVIENIGKKDEFLEGWKVCRKIEGKSPVNFNIPRITISGNKKIKIWVQGGKRAGSSDFECDAKSMGVGGNIETILLNAEGEVRATHTPKSYGTYKTIG